MSPLRHSHAQGVRGAKWCQSSVIFPTTASCRFLLDNKMVPGACEKIGLTNFGTTHFHQLTLWGTDGNSISSHVPGTVSPAGALAKA